MIMGLITQVDMGILLFAAYALAAALISFGICVLAYPIGQATGLMDDPKAKAHSAHYVTTPLVGGIAIIVPWVIVAELNPFLMHLFIPDQAELYPRFWLSAFLITFVVIGALDDKFHLSARLRLLIMMPFFTLLVYCYPDFAIQRLTAPAFGISVPLGIFSAPFTALCMLAFTNAVNMADGRNGLVIGFGVIWSVALLGYSPPYFSVLLFATLASLLVTGAFNLKGRLFLGDAGTYALATILGLTSLYAHGQPIEADGISSTQLATLFAIPGLDMFRLIASRVARGASPMLGDHDHLHHRLDRQFGWRQGLPVYLALVALPVLIGLSSPIMGTAGLVCAILLYCAFWYVTRESRQRTFGMVAQEG